MTRINVIAPQELADQWLLAEYRELPRVIKGEFDITNAPDKYQLGAGHVKWAKRYAYWTMTRYFQICDEMKYRGFKVNNSAGELYKLWDGKGDIYYVTAKDIIINVKRLRAKYNLKSNYYKWTGRDKPKWI
ncbi:MAG: hypothetical protein J6W96_06225 [Alphaproteobacteria bacterium]|nr:hypothetical protein [Alphaproteobacteria bacterium]